MQLPNRGWPFLFAPRSAQGEEENVIMATRRKMYALLQAREQEPDEDYNVNLVSTVRVIK